LSQSRLPRLHATAQKVVHDQMPVFVVVTFEVVHIEQEDGERNPGVACLPNAEADLDVPGAAVRRPREAAVVESSPSPKHSSCLAAWLARAARPSTV
jgi:hypothetical protein